MRTKEADVKYILTEEAESMMKQVRQAPSAYHCPKDNKHANGHSSIIRDATEDHHNSYILEQMLSTYRSCAQESGTGMKNRMFGIMAAKMRSGTIFTNIRRRIQKEMNALFEQRASSLSQQLEQVCEQIGADLAVLRGSEATLMEEDPEVLDAMEQMVAEAKKTLDKLQDTAAPARAEARKRSYI